MAEHASVRLSLRKKIVEVGRGSGPADRRKARVMDGVEAVFYFALAVAAMTLVAGLWELRWR